MPLNESTGPRFSNLTREQRRAADAAIFGIKETDLMAPGLSNEEIERMRQILQQHDAQNGAKGLKSFDLNAPPKEPYRHQEFPRVMYHHKKRQTRVAQNLEHMEMALEAGWSKEPFPVEVAEPELDPETRAEVAKLDAEARKPKKKE